MFARTGVSPMVPVHSMRVPRSWLVPSAGCPGICAEAVPAPSPMRAEVAATARAPVRSWVRMSFRFPWVVDRTPWIRPAAAAGCMRDRGIFLLGLRDAGHVEVRHPQRRGRGAGEVVVAPLAAEARHGRR